MNSRKVSVFLILILVTSSCNLPSNMSTGEDDNLPPAPPEGVTPLPTQLQATAVPSATPLPTNSPLPTLTGTPAIPIAWPKEVGVNCRYGDGIEWLVIGALLVEQTATIQGKNAAGTWWYVTTPNSPGTPCWVSDSVTNTAGNLANLPIINPPLASVTNVSIQKPSKIKVPGCMGPIQPMDLKGAIEVNGPATVKWHFATEQGGALATGTTNFDEFGSKDVSDNSYTPPLTAGDYWVRLVIESPNNKQAEKSYTIECP